VLQERVLSRALPEGVVPRALPEGVVPRALPEGVVPHTFPADDRLVMRLEDDFPAGHEVVSRTEGGSGIMAFGGIIIGIPASGVPAGGGGDGMGIHIIRTATDTTTTITTIRDPVILMVHRTVIMAAIRHR
jgi:hypothetical protein